MTSDQGSDGGPDRGPAPTVSIGRRLASGSAWMVAMRWSMRGIGLASTIILARLLTPADFGVVAMAMLVVGLLEVFGQTGQQFALIRHPAPTREHFDTAWTISVLIGLTLGSAVLLAAPLAERFFHQPEVVDVIRVLSLRVFASGFENIGTVWFRKSLNFATEFRFNLYKKLSSFTVTLVVALIWRDYWALVAGIVVGQLVSLAVSYAIHPYRPWFCLSKVRELWSFSVWVLINHVGAFGQNSIDQFVVGALAPPRIMGQYTVGAELALLPTTEIVDPIGRALFPVLSQLNQDRDRLRAMLLDVFGLIALLATAGATGLALVADDLVLVLLGPGWRETAPLIPWLAFAGALIAFANVAGLMFNALGDARRGAVQTWLCTLTLLPALSLAAWLGDLQAIVIARLAVWAFILPLSLHYLLKHLPLGWGDLAAVAWRPVLAAVGMAWALTVIPFDAATTIPALRLGLRVATGAAVYGLVLMTVWALAGRPHGIERLAMAVVARPRAV